MGETLQVPAYSEMEVMANLVQPEASRNMDYGRRHHPRDGSSFPACQPVVVMVVVNCNYAVMDYLL